MGMEIGRTLIDAISNDNVIQEGNSQWLVYSVLTIGSRGMHSTEADTAATEQMLGIEHRDGFLLQDVAVNFLFSERQHSWSCQELWKRGRTV